MNNLDWETVGNTYFAISVIMWLILGIIYLTTLLPESYPFVEKNMMRYAIIIFSLLLLTPFAPLLLPVVLVMGIWALITLS
jgi:hypothetical protein